MNLNDLPDEMLCTIFDYLDVDELKVASLVCRRWCELTFSGRRMDRVLLVKRDCNGDFFKYSKRNYRNVRQPLVYDIQIESFVQLLYIIKPHVRMVDIQCVVTSEQLGSILLEVPAIQHLSLYFVKFNCNTNATFPVLPKLKSLAFNGSTNDSFVLSFTHMANLQCLEMECLTDLQLEAWTYFSRQLKLVHVQEFDTRYLHPFLELTFPRLEDLTIEMYEFTFNEEMDLEKSNDFFRRHPFLRRLSCEFFPVTMVRIISYHCPELTHLYQVIVDVPEDGILESLVRLTKLKHLSLNGEVDRKILRGPMKSLESVELEVPHPKVLLENLFEVVPRLSCLKIAYPISCDVLKFICEKFSYLRRLDLSFSCEFLSLADDSVRIDKLRLLQDLELSGIIKIRSIYRNDVRCLRIECASLVIMDEDLYQIPEKFPSLKRLSFGIDTLSEAMVERLHKLMPSCRIDCEFGNKRFYPISDVTAD